MRAKLNKATRPSKVLMVALAVMLGAATGVLAHTRDVHYTDGFMQIDLGHEHVDNVWMADKSDSVYGDAWGDSPSEQGADGHAEGNNGDDDVSGGDGGDNVYGDNGNDYVHGDAGGDTIHGGQDQDTMDGGQGQDDLYANDGYADHVDGGDDVDTCNVDNHDTYLSCQAY